MAGLIVRSIRLLKSGDMPEKVMHKAIMQLVRVHPLLKRIVIHVPNEGKRSVQYGHELNLMGMRAGVYDLFIATARHNYIGAWVELKSKNGKLRPEQMEFAKDMEEQNYFTKVCRSIEETIETINWYVFPKMEHHHH